MIDYIKAFTTDHMLGRGWAKIPKNISDAKVKIIRLLLALRKEDEMGMYILDQKRLLSMFSNM